MWKRFNETKERGTVWGCVNATKRFDSLEGEASRRRDAEKVKDLLGVACNGYRGLMTDGDMPELSKMEFARKGGQSRGWDSAVNGMNTYLVAVDEAGGKRSEIFVNAFSGPQACRIARKGFASAGSLRVFVERMFQGYTGYGDCVDDRADIDGSALRCAAERGMVMA